MYYVDITVLILSFTLYVCRTGFTDRFGHADLGGKGTREFTDETGFLTG